MQNRQDSDKTRSRSLPNYAQRRPGLYGDQAPRVPGAQYQSRDARFDPAVLPTPASTPGGPIPATRKPRFHTSAHYVKIGGAEVETVL